MRAKRKQKEPISILLLMLVLLLGVARFFFPMGCQAATTYKVYFRENGGGKGTDGQMSRLTVTVKKGKKVILPELPEKQGYLSLGWTSVKKGTSVEYRPGESVTIKSATTFYAVRQKRVKCKVKFKNNKGTSGKSPYKELAMTVYAGDKAVLPKVPPYAGYEGLGWTTTKAGTSPLYLEGSEVTVEDSITYYAVRKKSSAVSISFFSKEGKTEDKYASLATTVFQGAEVTLPEVEPDPGYTFLGWSQSQGRETNPEYLAGATLSLQRSMNLYAVMYPYVKEQNVTELPVGWQQVFRKIVFVGDSRMNRMNQTLKVAFGLSPNLVEVNFICAEGKGLSWFKDTGKNQLISLLGYGVKPAAVIFNLGVNDLGNAKDYVSYLKSIKDELNAKNCKLYFMSVNPVSHPLLIKVAKNQSALSRTAAKVLAFNKKVKEGLCEGGDYIYLDMYSYLISTGFRFDSGGKDGKDTLVEDGLHYSGKTYKRIYSKTIALLLGQT